MTRSVKRLLLGAAAVVALSLGYLVEERVRGIAALSHWQAEMRAKGERLTLAEVVPLVPTNSQCRILSPEEADTRLAAVTSMHAHVPAMRYVAPGKAQALWQADSWRVDRKWTNGWAPVTNSLRAAMPAIEQLRADLLSHAIAVKPAYDQGFAAPMPHLARCRDAALTLKTTTQLALRQHRLDSAAQDLAAIAALVDLSAGQCWVMGELMRQGVAGIAVATLWEALQADGWSDAQLALIQDAWRKPSFMSGMARAFEVERALGSVYFDRHRYSLPQHYELLQEVRAPVWGGPGNGASTDETGWVGEAVRWLAELGAKSRHLVGVGIWRVSWLEQDQLRHQRLFQQAIEQLRREACEKHFRKSPETASQGASADVGVSPVIPTGWQYMRYWISTSMLPPIERSSTQAALSDAQWELAATALAIKRYEVRHGGLPDRLEALAPEFLPTTPRDWYAGTPLHYRAQQDGSFRLYSTGSDGEDDGGNPCPSPAGSRPSLSQGKDLVWPQAATAAEVTEFEAAM